MSKRQKSVPEEKPGPEPGPAVEEEEPVPETRRTRSGRRVRTPAALLNSEPPVRTPTRRTRRSVLQELPAVEEKNTEESTRIPETLPEEEKPSIAPPEPEPCAVSEPVDTAAEPDTEDAQPVRPEPAETVPKTTETTETSDTAPPSKKPRLAPNVTQIPVVPLGKPKSGRVWKNRNKQRFSALVRDKPLCSSWEKKMQNKREKELVKQFSQQLKDEDARKKEEKRKRREDNLKRRTENERKAEIVQVIRNTSKIKRMKKKQLRKIEKRDTLALLQKSQKQNVKTKGQKNKTDKDLT